MRILLIEDNPGDARLIREMLSEANEGTAELECEETLASGLERLGSERFDVLLLDLTLPDSHGLETLQKVSPFEQKVPVVVLTGLEDEETAQKSLESGAQDYLVKGKISADSLVRVIRYAMVRRSAEEALRVSEEHFRRLVENAGEIILTTDLDLIVTYASPSVERQTGFTVEEGIGRSVREFITAGSFDVIAAALADQLARQRETDVTPPVPVMIEVEQCRKDGSTYPAEVSAGFLRDHDGTPYGVIVVSRNITERKEAEEALRNSEEHFRLLFDNAGEAIFSYDSELVLTDINRLGCEAIGYSREELIGKSILELGILHPDETETAANAIRRLFDGEDIVEAEYTFIRKDGAERLFTVIGAAIRDPGGDLQSITNMCRDVTEERLVEEALRRTQFTVDHSADSVFWVTSKGKIIYANDEACLRRGYTREEMLSLTIFDINDSIAADNDLWESCVERIQREGHFAIEFRHRTKGGELFPVEAMLKLFKLEDDWLFIAIDRDITERKEAEKKVERAQQEAVSVLMSSPDAVLMTDPETGVIVDCNRAAELLLERPRDELVGMHQTELHPPEYASHYAEMFREHVRLGRGVEDEAQVITSGGELKDVTIYPVVLSLGDRVLSLGVFHDVSERRRAAQGLRVLNEIALRLIGAEPGGLYGDIEQVLEEVAALVGTDRCFIHLSSYETGLVEQAYEWRRDGLEPRAEGLVGMDVNQLRWLVSELESSKLIRFSCLEELPPEAEVEKAAWGAAGIKALLGVPFFRGGILVGFMGLTSELVERSWRDADALFLQQASSLIFLAIERARAEDALLESGAALEHSAQELRDILTIAAHELRHPATIFKGYSHILLKNADNLDSEVARDALRSIDSASDRLARTVNQLLEASRIESGEMSLRFEEFEPYTLLNRVTAEFQDTGANINTSDKTGVGAVFKADREKLRAVLANLVENAIKFSPDGSPVDVCVEAASGGLLFSVCDEGPGISEEHAELVFERFYQVEDVEHHSTPGIGLGLFIAKTIVDEHGGWIRYRPNGGGGSIFEFFIPGHPLAEVCPETEHERVLAESSPSSEACPPDETGDDAGLNDNGTKRVLRVAVIDDDPDIVKVNMMMLESRGYEAIAAYGGEEGLEMVGRETPDVVLLDIMMPGLDGFETCRRLKSDERTRDIPVIFVTAKTSEECSEEVLAAGGSGFLSKPFRPNELFESIEEVRGVVRNGVLSAVHTKR